MAWFEPIAVAGHRGPPRAALGGVGPLRARARPLRHRPGHRPLRRAAPRDVPRPRRPRRARRRPRRAAARAPLGAGAARPGQRACSAPRSRPQEMVERCSTRSASRPCPTRAACSTSACRRGGPTASRGRRDRGGRPPLRLRAARQDRAEVRRARPALTDRRPGAGCCARCCSGSGISEAMPNPFLAPDDLDRAGLDARGLTIANPLVAEESVLRTSLRPGLFKAMAYNESHRVRRRRPVRDRPHLPCRRRSPLPDEREVLGVALAGREGPAAVPVLQEVVAALGLADRVRLAAPSVDAAGALAGMHPGRSSVVTVGRPAGRGRRRGRPRRARGLRHPRSGGVAGARPRPSCSDLEPADRAVAAGQPLPVERHRPGLRRRRRRHGRRRPRRHRAGPPAPCWSTSSCSTSTADRGSRPANAAWPSGSACRRPTTRSPMPRWPPCATPSSPRPPHGRTPRRRHGRVRPVRCRRTAASWTLAERSE